MANNKIVFEVVATSKGFKVVQDQQEKLGKSVDKNTKSFKEGNKKQDDYFNRQEKGVIGVANGTKSFSKMQQTIGSGSSGLVGAYATLAANVFAATAAFNALRQAAQVETLAQGFDFLANAAGRSSDIIAGKLREITNNAVSLEEALRSSAIAITSGFGTKEIEELTLVARNASIALGRNLGDSLDRLFRGVAKLEPEILDELGIMVRLDSAVENYANQLGKAGSDLSDFERRQAFLNATIAQGALKYGDLTEELDPNPYDQLASAFADLTREGITFLNTFITPLVSILANNKGTLLGVLILFASTIVSTMFPVLAQLGDRQIQAAKQAAFAAQLEETSALRRKQAAESLILAQKGGGKAVQALRKGIQNNTAGQKDYQKALSALIKSEKIRETNLRNGNVKNVQAKEKELEAVRNLRREVEKLANEERDRSGFSTQARVKGQQASAKRTLGEQTMFIQGGGAVAGFKQASTGLDKYRKKLLVTARTQGGFVKKDGKYSFTSFGARAKFGFQVAAGGARLFGAALLNAIPIIGQLIFGISLVIGFFKKFAGRSEELTSSLKTFETVTGTVDEKLQQLERTNGRLAEKFEKLTGTIDQTVISGKELANTIKVIAGISNELSTSFSDAATLIGEEKYTQFKLIMIAIGDAVKGAINKISELSSVIGTQLLKALERVSPALKLILTVFKAFREDAPSERDVKFEALTELAKQTEAGYAKILEQNDAVKAKYNEIFGDGGISGIISKARADNESYADTVEKVNAKIQEFDTFTANLNGTIESLNKGLVQADKALGSMQSGFANKNEFDKIADQFENIENTINSLRGSLGRESSEQLFASSFTEGQIATLEKFGITATNAFDIVERTLGKSTTRLEQFVGQTRNLADLVRTTKDSISAQNAVEKERKAQEGLNVAKIKTNALDASRSAAGAEDRADFEQAAARQITSLRLEGIEAERKAKISIIEAEFALLRAKLEFDKSLTETEKTRLSTLLTTQENARKAEANGAAALAKQEEENALKIKRLKAGQEGTQVERIQAVGAAGFFEEGSDATLAEKVNATRGMLTPMMDDLKKLGPEGELVAGVAQGALLIADAFAVFGSEAATTADKIAAVGAVVAQMSSIIQANSKAQIAEIDNQIKAEQKRDGKSAESINKIKAMEAKKDAMAKKAFERNKKMQIAQTIINTASAIVAVLDDVPFPANVALATMMGALGAAQLAIIQKSQYQGSAGNVATPSTSLQIGGRSSAVDVAKQTSAGELNYLRGGRTTGQDLGGAGASFPGGAMGRRGYANGGEGIMVGERGPEVITPSAPVDITPNYALGGTPTNVNFSITTLDASGVEDVLTNQRGNIIRMIREAANENGEMFLESVDPTVYGGGG